MKNEINKNKRYLLFSGIISYPYGGMNDFQGSFPTIEQCKKHAESIATRYYWAHIVDAETNEIVLSGDVSPDTSEIFEWDQTV